MPGQCCSPAPTVVMPARHRECSCLVRRTARCSAAAEKSRNRTNELMKTGIVEDAQPLARWAGKASLGTVRAQAQGGGPWRVLRTLAKKSRNRANELMEKSIIECGQSLGRHLSARVRREADDGLGSGFRGN